MSVWDDDHLMVMDDGGLMWGPIPSHTLNDPFPVDS